MLACKYMVLLAFMFFERTHGKQPTIKGRICLMRKGRRSKMNFRKYMTGSLFLSRKTRVNGDQNPSDHSMQLFIVQL